MDIPTPSHGNATKTPEPFSKLLESKFPGYDRNDLATLATQMVSDPDSLSDGPDPEENMYVPAGYTYLGQFIDHDLTLDTTSSLKLDPSALQDNEINIPTNRRTPRFDLDCLYGDGPADQPYLYAQFTDEAAGIFQDATLEIGEFDLIRAPNGRALIGDKRNDENSIVNQIQQIFIRFHNQVVRELARQDAQLRKEALFNAARDQVRWAYQTVIKQDFLPRIINGKILQDFLDDRADSGKSAYKLYTHDKWYNLPREFVAAAYRFGHSMVRTGYRLNGTDDPSGKSGDGTRLPIFTPSNAGDLSLVGFAPLPRSHVIDDWRRFFPEGAPLPGQALLKNAGPKFEAKDHLFNAEVRLQYAYKIDPSLADPLGKLPPVVAQSGDVPEEVRPCGAPSLALLNLLRGNSYQIQGGQAYVRALKNAGVQDATELDPKYLVCRKRHDGSGGGSTYTFENIPTGLLNDTPLWFYILAEAQVSLVDLWNRRKESDPDAQLKEDELKDLPEANATQLGLVGGRIVAEVFYGLLDQDTTSVEYHGGDDFAPIWGGTAPHTFMHLIKFAGGTNPTATSPL